MRSALAFSLALIAHRALLAELAFLGRLGSASTPPRTPGSPSSWERRCCSPGSSTLRLRCTLSGHLWPPHLGSGRRRADTFDRPPGRRHRGRPPCYGFIPGVRRVRADRHTVLAPATPRAALGGCPERSTGSARVSLHPSIVRIGTCRGQRSPGVAPALVGVVAVPRRAERPGRSFLRSDRRWIATNHNSAATQTSNAIQKFSRIPST